MLKLEFDEKGFVGYAVDLTVVARSFLKKEELNMEDQEVSGKYDLRATFPTASFAGLEENALDQFHSKVPINDLECFDFDIVFSKEFPTEDLADREFDISISAIRAWLLHFGLDTGSPSVQTILNAQPEDPVDNAKMGLLLSKLERGRLGAAGLQGALDVLTNSSYWTLAA